VSLSLLDTNVLVYRHDPRDRVKQRRAIEVMDRLVGTGEACISVQCLIEFFRVVTQRLPDRIDLPAARAEAERLTLVCQVFTVTPQMALEGFRGSEQHGLSVWDAQIWACARFSQVSTVLTEDADHGRLVEGVRYLNPFDARFHVTSI
jgi:predicted nucleic acid-binding protein